MNAKAVDSPERAAIHEAGHLVVAIDLGAFVRSSEIRAHRGFTTLTGWEHSPLHDTAFLFAGGEAEELLLGSVDHVHSEPDLAEFRRLVPPSDSTRAAGVEAEARRLVRRILGSRRHQVRAVADAFVQRARVGENAELTGVEIHALVRQSAGRGKEPR
jgi:hypothetical protein